MESVPSFITKISMFDGQLGIAVTPSSTDNRDWFGRIILLVQLVAKSPSIHWFRKLHDDILGNCHLGLVGIGGLGGNVWPECINSRGGLNYRSGD